MTAAWPRLRRFNFGRRVMDRPVTAEWLEAEIARYDADDAEVSRRTRQEATLEDAVHSHVSLCREVLEEARPVDARTEWEALARYLQHPDGGRHLYHHHRVIRSLQIERMQQDYNFHVELKRVHLEYRQTRETLIREFAAGREALQAELASCEAARQAAADELAQLRQTILGFRGELDAIRQSATVRWRERLGQVPLLNGCLRVLASYL